MIPFDQREISVIIEHDFCFATLENRVYSSASAESALNPLISRDKLPIAVIETPLKSSQKYLKFRDQAICLSLSVG